MTLHPSLQSILSWLKVPDITDCYQLLGLTSGADFAEIKASYQQLLKKYNYDIISVDQQAKDKFIAATEAYNTLVSLVQPPQNDEKLAASDLDSQRQSMTYRNTDKNPLPSEFEEQLKWLSYHKLQQFLKGQQFPQAIAIVEGLAQRLPHDRQVSQWQAIAYQSWGRQLLNDRQLKKARIYLKKALKIDPHNRELWSEVEQDFYRLEQML